MLHELKCCINLYEKVPYLLPIIYVIKWHEIDVTSFNIFSDWFLCSACRLLALAELDTPACFLFLVWIVSFRIWSGRSLPCNFIYSPHALQTAWLWLLRRQSDVFDVLQLAQVVDGLNRAPRLTWSLRVMFKRVVVHWVTLNYYCWKIKPEMEILSYHPS